MNLVGIKSYSAAIRIYPKGCNGFSLAELVVVIAIGGIIAAIIGVFIVRPIQGYDALVHRADLVDIAEGALRRMQREIRRALPNSIRVAGGGTALELIPAVDGGRYRESPPGNSNARLQFNTADTDFDMLGNLLCTTHPDITGPCASYSDPANFRLVIYNLGQPGADAYAGTDVITVGSTITVTSFPNPGSAADGSDHINVNPGFDFAFESPSQRFFVVQNPVSYICNPAARTLTRYQGYALTSNQANIDTDAELAAMTPAAGIGVIADRIAVPCRFGYTPGTDTRSGVVTIEIALRDPVTNESVRLLHQVHVDNAP